MSGLDELAQILRDHRTGIARQTDHACAETILASPRLLDCLIEAGVLQEQQPVDVLRPGGLRSRYRVFRTAREVGGSSE